MNVKEKSLIFGKNKYVKRFFATKKAALSGQPSLIKYYALIAKA